MSNKRQFAAIGLDIGGTKIAAGVVLWPSGEILRRTVIPTRPTRGGEPVLSDTLALAAQLNDWALKDGIQDKGHWSRRRRVGGLRWQRHQQLHDSLAWPSRCRRDFRNCPGAGRIGRSRRRFGRSNFWRGPKSRLFVYVTVGTGISSCLMQNGYPLQGRERQCHYAVQQPTEHSMYALRREAASGSGRVRFRSSHCEALRSPPEKSENHAQGGSSGARLPCSLKRRQCRRQKS